MLSSIYLPLVPFPPSACSDRLGELERDKARLSEQLIAQQREHLVREMDILKKSKSKNLLKKGFKKLKGKIQVGGCLLHVCVHVHVGGLRGGGIGGCGVG